MKSLQIYSTEKDTHKSRKPLSSAYPIGNIKKPICLEKSLIALKKQKGDPVSLQNTSSRKLLKE